MDMLTDSITEMEEWLSEDVPCGGNSFPISRPCPDSAAAHFIKVHNACGLSPQSFKCATCLTEWMHGSPNSHCACRYCSYRELKSEAYRLL